LWDIDFESQVFSNGNSEFISNQVGIGVLNLLIHTAHTRSGGSFEVDEASLAPGGTPGVSDDEVWSGGTSASVIAEADSNDGVV